MKNKITKLFFVLLISSVAANAQTEKQRQEIVSKIDAPKLKALAKETLINEEKNLKLAKEKALSKGMPLEGVNEAGEFYQLVGFYEGTTDLKYYKTYNKSGAEASEYFFNNNGTNSSLNTLKATYLHNKDILGQDMIAGEWDGGVPISGHYAIIGRVTVRDNGAAISTQGVAHSTHVSGTIMSSGEGATGLDKTKGFLPKGRLWAANWTNDLSEMTSAASEGLLVSNHSYGPDPSQPGFSRTLFGQYNSEARAVDLIANSNPYYTIVVAAGNERDSYMTYQPNKGGRDLITTMGVSKNTVTVAAVNGVGNYSGPSSVVIASFSNYGPSDDYRIKPDIAAKGVNVLSLGTGVTSTATMSGTSMAAPAVTGGIGLWQQYYHSLFDTHMLSSTVRGLMAHTAEEAGPADGPDYMYGWGLMNLEEGAKVMEDYKVSKAWILEQELTNGSYFSNDFEYDGTSPLKVTLAWNDPAANATSANDERFSKLVNDLDLRVVNLDTQVTYLPWALVKSDTTTGTPGNEIAVKKDNDVDNIEKVEIKGAPAGNYKVLVTHKGTTLRGGKQLYSLILSGSGTTLATKQYLFENVNVFPNPAKNTLNVSLPAEIATGVSYEIFDVNGKKVKSVSNKADAQAISIDISNMATGLYILKLKSNEGSSSYKFIKE